MYNLNVRKLKIHPIIKPRLDNCRQDYISEDNYTVPLSYGPVLAHTLSLLQICFG